MPSCLLLIAALVAAQVAVSSPAEPVVAVWYRGTPAGTPRQDDLAAIRAQGFTGVTWPAGQTSRVDELRRIAGSLGLAVTVQAAPVPLTAASALRPTDRVDVDVTHLAADGIPALVWRAVGHGARTIAFDSGSQAGAPLTDATGRPLPWVGAASAIARQLTFNARLFLDARAGPRIAIQPPAPAGVDVVLLETGRAWMQRITAHFPRLVWLNPEPQDRWKWTPSVGIARELVSERMFPLTLDGIDRAMTELKRSSRAAPVPPS